MIRLLIILLIVGCSTQKNILSKKTISDRCLEEVHLSGVKTGNDFFFYKNFILFYKNDKYDKIILIDFKKENFKSELIEHMYPFIPFNVKKNGERDYLFVPQAKISHVCYALSVEVVKVNSEKLIFNFKYTDYSGNLFLDSFNLRNCDNGR